MDLDRVLLRCAPFAGLGSLFWVAYRLMTARLFRFLDLVAIVTLLVVLYEMHGMATKVAKIEDERDHRGR